MCRVNHAGPVTRSCTKAESSTASWLMALTRGHRATEGPLGRAIAVAARKQHQATAAGLYCTCCPGQWLRDPEATLTCRKLSILVDGCKAVNRSMLGLAAGWPKGACGACTAADFPNVVILINVQVAVLGGAATARLTRLQIYQHESHSRLWARRDVHGPGPKGLKLDFVCVALTAGKSCGGRCCQQKESTFRSGTQC